MDGNLKLIYVHKIGYNSKGEGNYEFIFSRDETNIDEESWCWDLEPAESNAMPPTEDYIDGTYGLKTKDFDLECLCDSVDRPYMHGYHNIIALAYEIEYVGEIDGDGFNQYEEMFNNDGDDSPLLVFHYGMSLERVKEKLYERSIILRGDEFIKSSSIKIE